VVVAVLVVAHQTQLAQLVLALLNGVAVVVALL
jgi:hypothetical protein